MKNHVVTIRDIPLSVEVADTEELRQKGLMNRMNLAHDSGMLFIFEEPRELGFWMKNTRIPLSIAFLSSTGDILNIEDMNPYDSTTQKSISDARCAIEVNQGWFKRNGINPGDTVSGIPIEDTVTITEDKLREIVRNVLLG